MDLHKAEDDDKTCLQFTMVLIMAKFHTLAVGVSSSTDLLLKERRCGCMFLKKARVFTIVLNTSPDVA